MMREPLAAKLRGEARPSVPTYAMRAPGAPGRNITVAFITSRHPVKTGSLAAGSSRFQVSCNRWETMPAQTGSVIVDGSPERAGLAVALAG